MVMCEVNKTFLPVKALYFFYLSGKASLAPYLPIFFKQLGLTTLQVGIIFGLEPFIGFAFKPIWSFISDKLSKHKLFLIVGMLAMGIFTFTCRFVPSYQHYSNETYKSANYSMCNNMTEVPVQQTQHLDQDIEWMAVNILCNNNNCCDSQNIRHIPDGYPYNHPGVLLECIKLSIFWNSSTCEQLCSDISEQSNTSDHDCTNRFTVQPYSSVPLNITAATSYCPDKCNLTKNGNSVVCNCPKIDFNKLRSTKESSSVPNTTRYENSSSLCNVTELQEFSIGNNSLTFWLCLLLIQLASAFGCLVHPIIDMTVYELLGDKRGNYGKQRMWGAVGFGSFAVISGLLMDAFSNDFTSASNKNYDPAFILFITLVIMSSIITTCLNMPSLVSSQSLLVNTSLLLRQADIVAFLIIVVVFGMCFGTIMTYLFWFLQELGASQTLMGITLLITCISEAPFLFYSGNMIKYLGHKGVFYIVLLSYIVRFVGYSFITSAWYVLPLELLHGITFGAMFAAVTSYASIISPPGMAATVQSLVQACNMGLGKGLGAIFGGVMYNAYGGRILFRCCAGLCFITALLYWIVQFCVVHKTPFYSKFRTRNESVSLQEPGEDATTDRDIQELLEDEDDMMAHHKMSSRVMKLNLRSVHRPHQVAKYDQDSEATRGLILDLSPVVSDISPPKGVNELSPSVMSVSSRVPMLDPDTSARQPAVGEEESEHSMKMPSLGMETFYIDDQIEDIAMEYDMGMGSTGIDHDDL
ncbi:major facilitator superfamily domain-containing protein 6-like [Saccoglossus kowalevskii]|uniref:Major facilitator superfamily domain-containing protein 6-like n=1 Tax=Saccoglossus kowalevskii TaxID=10224 RepID=A0ABM0MWL3_SACKO|nr:PREDICTED: major facilitator superfamily domain-containing protein 6-like [Saccoglossus kowalevskii]